MQEHQLSRLEAARDLLFASLEDFDRNRGKIYLACSGGLDSMALMYALKSWLGPKGIPFTVLHVNYQLRGEESHGDEALVKEQAALLECPYLCLYPEANPKGKVGIQAWARTVRYDWFRTIAQTGDRVLLAHHEDDQIETILMRIMRGSSLLSLGGMKVSEGLYLRPFLQTTRKTLEEFVHQAKVPFREDSSNRGLDYSRNRLRHIVLPELEAMFPGAGLNLLVLARSSQEWGSYAARTLASEEPALRTPAEWRELGFAPSAQVFIEEAIKLGLSDKSAIQVRRPWLQALYQSLVQGVNTTFEWNEDWEVRVDKGQFDIRRKTHSQANSNRWKQYQGELTNSGLASCLSPGSSLELELDGDPEMQDNKNTRVSSK